MEIIDAKPFWNKTDRFFHLRPEGKENDQHDDQDQKANKSYHSPGSIGETEG